MNERELLAIINQAERDTAVDSDLTSLAENIFDRYSGRLYGNEEEDRSKVVTSEVSDVVESDMTSLARVLLGSGDVCQFKPTSSNPQAIEEAEQKQIYIPWIIKNAKNSFRAQHDWLKSSEMQPFAMLEYGMETTASPEEKTYKGVDADYITALINDFEEDDGITRVDIVSQDEAGEEVFDVTIKLVREKQEYFLKSHPFENIIISPNAHNKHDADVVGYKFRKTRSDLIAEGYEKDLVMSLPSKDSEDNSELAQKRFHKQGGEQDNKGVLDKANELVEGCIVFINVDYDDDGIAERRKVIKAGNKILENEIFNHVPFAIISSMLMPNNIVGRCRGELALEPQKISTYFRRGVVDNIAQVSNPRMLVNEDMAEIDDFLDARFAGVARVNGDVRLAAMPLTVPYIGGEIMQASQYIDAATAESTGIQLASQGLDSDQLNQETATRFNGMEDAGKAKIELVARVIAEVGYRDLYEGLAWFASHYQDKPKEIFVLGKPLTVDPNKWRYDHQVCAEVGTGAGDDQKAIQILTGILATQSQYIAEGSRLSDEGKQYNTLKKMIEKLGLNSVDKYFNDPSQPDQVVTAERDILKKQVQAMSQQLEANNPLIAMEQVKAGAKQQGDQLKGEIQMQQLMVKMQQDQAKMQSDNQKFMLDLAQKQEQFLAEQMLQYTKLELDHNTDIEGQGI